jgi:hypothetical protein
VWAKAGGRAPHYIIYKPMGSVLFRTDLAVTPLDLPLPSHSTPPPAAFYAHTATHFMPTISISSAVSRSYLCVCVGGRRERGRSERGRKGEREGKG